MAVRGDFAAPPRVQAAGEISGWDMPLAVPVTLDAEGAARGTLSLTLSPGVFAYKLLVDGQWQLDAEAPRTRSQDGRRNQVLSLGGTPDPVLFAPGRPWLAEAERGGVRVTAGLRRGSGEALALLWREPADSHEHVTAMERVDEEDEHLLFEARLPVSSGRLSLRFRLESGELIGSEETPGAPLEWQAPPDSTPSWWRDAVVYTVFVDRFRPRHFHSKWERDPGARKAAGGHLDGVTDALPALAEIGVNVLYLTPVHVGASCHRYDIVDPARVDPQLGGEAAFSRLIDAAHSMGIRVVLDFTCSHAGSGFPPYEDVRAKGRASLYAPWFQWKDASSLRHYGTRSDAPLFDPEHPEVRAYFLDLVKRWAERGIDGLRLDAAAEVGFELSRQIHRALRAVRPDAVMFAEYVHLHTYRFIEEEAGDAATEFGFHDGAVPFLAEGSLDGAALARRLLRLERERGAPAHRAVRFVCTHDHPRLATLARLRGRSHMVPLGFVMLFTLPGVPALLYGEELGLCADRPEHVPEHVWPDRMPMPWRGEAWKKGAALRRTVAELAALRRATPALRGGELSFASGEGGVLVYRREAAGEVIDVALNSGPAAEVALDDDAGTSAELLFATGPARLEGTTAQLGPGGALVVRRTASPARRLRLAGTAVLRDRAFALSAIAPKVGPSRLDFAVTERCNLRCAHCITHAPERTATRTARALSPWLIDRLRGDLAHAEHFAFVHGGESLVSPMLEELLDAIREARLGLPAMAHLLSNGMLLSAATAERLAQRGVRSLSVSLDGATAGVNDAIREGGKFAQIVDNIRAVVERRREAGLDLRIGVSSVVMAQNVAELAALVDLCAGLGVDWLKLEEAVPATAFAARSLVRLDHGPAADAVAAACARGRAAGLVIVDHTVERPIWRCELEADPQGAALLEADGFANRTFIHPCRGPWEIACVEANGDVRIGDFFGPILGNVAEASLAELWHGEVAAAARRNAIAARLCREGPVTCMNERPARL